MTTDMTNAYGPGSRSRARQTLNKVPEVTLYFWVIKVLCTTVGETAADLLNDNLGMGLTNTSYLMGALLVGTLVLQFRARSYVPGLYWLSVVLISVVGTLISDNLTDNLGVPLQTTTVVFAVALAVTFFAWYASERTLSIHSIRTTRREAFYWLAILFTFALGTSMRRLDGGETESGVLALRGRVRGADRGRRPRPPRTRLQRGVVVLDRVRPDPAARCLAGRLPVAADRGRRSRTGHGRHQHPVPRRHPRPGRLPDPDPARCGGGRPLETAGARQVSPQEG